MIRIRRRAVILALALGLAAPSVIAQQAAPSPLPAAVAMPARWLQGYVTTVSGDTIVYPWAYPGQTRTLLSRATTGQMSVVWTAEPAPPGAADERVTYLWHAGTATGSGAHAFTFAINGSAVAVFRSGRTPDDRAWTVAGEGSATLSFRTTRVGTFNKLFGFMWVTAPRSLFGTGAPQFSVTGEAAGSRDYYLGPQEQVQTFVRARAEEAVFAGGEALSWSTERTASRAVVRSESFPAGVVSAVASCSANSSSRACRSGGVCRLNCSTAPGWRVISWISQRRKRGLPSDCRLETSAGFNAWYCVPSAVRRCRGLLSSDLGGEGERDQQEE